MVVDDGEVVGVAEVGGVEVLVVVEIVLFEFEDAVNGFFVIDIVEIINSFTLVQCSFPCRS